MVTEFTPEKIKIVLLREEIVFDARAIGLYESVDGKKVIVNNTGALVFLVSIIFCLSGSSSSSSSFSWECNIKSPCGLVV